MNLSCVSRMCLPLVISVFILTTGEVHAQPVDKITNEVIPAWACTDDLMGTFGIPKNIPSQDIITLAHEVFFSKETGAGDKAFRIYKDGSHYFKEGLRSGTVTPINIYSDKEMSKTAVDYYWDETPRCVADVGDGVYLYRVDFSDLSKDKSIKLKEFLSRLWGVTLLDADLRRIHYFFTINISEIGAGGITVMIPLQRISL